MFVTILLVNKVINNIRFFLYFSLLLTNTFVFVLKPYSLEMYKSKEDKLALLDESIKHHDGNVITAVSHISFFL